MAHPEGTGALATASAAGQDLLDNGNFTALQTLQTLTKRLGLDTQLDTPICDTNTYAIMFTSWQVDAKSDAWELALDRCFDIPPPPPQTRTKAGAHACTGARTYVGMQVCGYVLLLFSLFMSVFLYMW